MPGRPGSYRFISPPAGPPPAADARLGALPRRMLRDVAEAAAGTSDDRDRLVAAALAPYLGLRGLLDGVDCPCARDHYTRHLLHAGEGHSVLALVWRPGQMSPVHAHRTWCVFGIHRGWMAETFFTSGETVARPFGCVPRREGDVGHSPADPGAIHRLANLGTEDTLSIHVYGARHDRLGDEVNQVWAD
jgi:3-mercaptopropionate dioxygenase